MMSPGPEVYNFKNTRFVPNSPHPVLVYRQVLPHPYGEASIKEYIEPNEWIRGGTWGAIPRHHFHPNTHECYAIYKGSSTLLLGVGPLEDEEQGQKIHLEAGDVVILPAGVSHCSKDFKDDYTYVGLYPKGAPKWKNEYCKDEMRCQALGEEAEKVPVPEWDPVRGYRGPLYELWKPNPPSES